MKSVKIHSHKVASFLLSIIYCLVSIVCINCDDFGPDSFGYVATDNVSPLAPDAPFFNPHDVITVGTAVDGLGDDNCVPVTLPFNFTFYGLTYDIVQVCSNGFLKFTEGPFTTNFVGLDPITNTIISEPIPSPKYPAGIFFWFLDLDPTKTTSGGVFTLLVDPDGTPDTGDERFVIQYDNIPYINGQFPITIQIQLFNITNQIVIHYLSAPSPGVQDGKTINHVIGIQSAGGDNGVLYEFSNRSIPAGRSIRFFFPPLDPPAGYFVNDSINTAQFGKNGTKVLLQTFEPAFSAIFQSFAGDIANQFKLELSTTSNFQPGTTIPIFGRMSDVDAFKRIPDIVYKGPTLESGKEYFYRLTFWDEDLLRSRTEATGSSSFCIQSCTPSGLGAPFTGASGSTAGCFIATKTIQNKNKLSPFYIIRNNYLINSSFGKNIITTYYKNAQKIYSFLGKTLSTVTIPIYTYLNFAFSSSFTMKLLLLLLFSVLFISIKIKNAWL